MLQRAKWIRGAYDEFVALSGRIRRIIPTMLQVAWLCQRSPSGDLDDRELFSRPPKQLGKDVIYSDQIARWHQHSVSNKHLNHPLQTSGPRIPHVSIGDRVLFDKDRIGHDESNFLQHHFGDKPDETKTLTVCDVRTEITVQWQNAQQEKLDSTEVASRHSRSTSTQ